MKKTVIINIGHSIIHVEEEAYEVLTSYLLEIKQHFAKNADDFEIVNDIENRIAEMFAEILLQNNKQIVEMVDVQNVIGQMGSVKDFQTDEEGETQPNRFSSFLGDKKLFRDTDDSVIAGVCAGLGHYLNVEARWVRLIAFLSIFLGGSGILAYLILWIVVPVAVTRSEKMAMKGEATNLFGYKKSFEEELAAFKENMKSANTTHFQPFVKRSGGFINEFFAIIGRLIAFTLKIISKFLAGAFIVFGFCMLVSLLIGLAAFIGFWDSNFYSYFPFSIINEDFKITIVFGAFIVLFVPILALVLFAIRVAFNKMAINKTVSFVLLAVWLLGVSSTVYHIAKISSEFKEHAQLVKSSEIKTYASYVLEIDKNMKFSSEDSLALNIDNINSQKAVIIDDNDAPFSAPRNVNLRIEKSENGKTTIEQTHQSLGKTFPIALRNAQNINYNYSQKDSLLIFESKLSLKQKSLWRDQEVIVTLKVPVGTQFKIKKDLDNYLDFYYYWCENNNENTDYTEWVMTEDGLKCKSELDNPKENKP